MVAASSNLVVAVENFTKDSADQVSIKIGEKFELQEDAGGWTWVKSLTSGAEGW